MALKNTISSSLRTVPTLFLSLITLLFTLSSESQLPSESHCQIAPTHLPKILQFPPYPENPLIKQYNTEYWIIGDLMTPESLPAVSFSRRVFDVEESDVVFVLFFATLSVELQLGTAKGAFRKKVGNKDYERQQQVVDLVRGTPAWKRFGGPDHVFVLTGCSWLILSCGCWRPL
jgi:hypothetical protein